MTKENLLFIVAVKFLGGDKIFNEFVVETPKKYFMITGDFNKNIKHLEKLFNVKINHRNNIFNFEGDKSNVKNIFNFFQKLNDVIDAGFKFYSEDLDYLYNLYKSNPDINFKDVFLKNVVIEKNKTRKTITPKTLTQKIYIETIKNNVVTFGIGPAGTGKTFLAIAVALSYLTQSKVGKVILTRPAVEAGEKLGFLPGDMIEKVNPYLRPLYDALDYILGSEKVKHLMEKGIVEVAPLAFMRGRTLNDAFIILDEAQNTTSEQMKMFLTRLGFNSKAVITGDITQIDLPNQKQSGLIEAKEILNNIDGIAFVRFTEMDVVRHKIVKSIIKAYENKSAK